MKIDNLKKLYRLVKQNDETYCVFDFRMNQVCFEIFYDIGVTPNKIGFLPIDDNRQLWLDVNLGFDVNSRLSHDNYYLLVDILGLKKDPKNKFNPMTSLLILIIEFLISIGL